MVVYITRYPELSKSPYQLRSISASIAGKAVKHGVACSFYIHVASKHISFRFKSPIDMIGRLMVVEVRSWRRFTAVVRLPPRVDIT